MQAQESEPDQPISEETTNNLLEFYNVDTLEELITIIVDPVKSLSYLYVRENPVSHVDLQNIKTMKLLIQHRRQLLLGLFHQAEEQIKAKNKVHKDHARGEHKKFEKYKNKRNGTVLQNRMQENDIEVVSTHSYEELQAYFSIYNDALLCKQILTQKYERCEVIHSHKCRKTFWLLLIGLKEKIERHSMMFNTLIEYTGEHDFFKKVIHADVVRTVHEKDEKQKKEIMDKLTKVLECFARRNPFIGYCQGMNFIANFLLTMGFEEEECFWILVGVLEELVPFGYYTNMSGVAVDLKIVNLILHEKHPEISIKLKSLEVDISIFALEWLVCLYTSTLPFYLLVIVWDLLLIEGSIVLLKVALVLLEHLKPIVEEAQDFAHFFKLYENYKKKILIEEDIFIKKYNSIFIDPTIISLAREIVEIEVRSAKDEVRKKTKDNMKWKEVSCNVDWPICFQQLKKQKHDDIDIDVWVFKEQGGPKIIFDYLSKKQKTLKEDERNETKKLLIGRVPHICSNSSSLAQLSDGIELEEVESIKNEGSFLVRSRKDSYSVNGEDTSTAFFHRATLNSFAFNFLNNPQKNH